MTETRETIARLLRTISGRKEVEEYLRHYSSVDSQRFAVIRIGAGLLAAERDSVAEALAFLQRVGLVPIVVHGAGRRLGEALASAGAEEHWVDGSPIIPIAAAEPMRRVYQEENLALVDALCAQGCAARPVPAGTFLADALDAEKHGLVGRVRVVDDSAVLSAVRGGQLPVITDLAISPSGQVLFVDDDDAVAALARRFEPHKIIYLTARGGLVDTRGVGIEAVNLAEDYDRLRRALEPEDAERLRRLRDMLLTLPETTSVSITSPDQLARELFTWRGAGTLIQRGEKVNHFNSFDEIDQPRLRDLLESCFGRRLADNYFSVKPCDRVYVTESYRATAVVIRVAGVPYLDKLAVTGRAQGEGLGGSLWACLRRDYPTLFWRAREGNAIRGWYFEQADGSIKRGQWIIYWYGLDDFDAIRRCIEAAENMPETLAPIEG